MCARALFVLFFWVFFEDYLRRAARLLVIAAAEAAARRAATAAAQERDGRCRLWLRLNEQRGVADTIAVATQSGLLIVGLAVSLVLGDGEETLQLLLRHAERVVAHTEGLLVDRVALRVVGAVAARSLRDALPLREGEEVGAELERQPHCQVRLAEDAVHLHLGVDDVGLVVLCVAVDVAALDREVVLIALVRDGLPALLELDVVRRPLLGRHLGRALRKMRKSLVILNGVPGEELGRERGVLALAELLHDGG